LSLRTTPQSHEEFRHICQGIYNLLMIIHPNLIKQLEFVDLNEYSLGRLKSEYNKENKLKNVIGEV
jgi:thymidylate synthase ThyX